MCDAKATAVVIGAMHGHGRARIRFDLARGVVEVERRYGGEDGAGSGPLSDADRALAERAARLLTPAHQAQVREDFFAWYTEYVEVERADGALLRVVNERGSLDLDVTSDLVGRAQQLATQLAPLSSEG